MKWVFWLLAIITIAAAIPVTEASIRIQSFGSGPLDFSGPTSIRAYGTGTSFAANYDNTYATVRYAGSSGGIAVGMQRPTSVVQHSFTDHNLNYRTIQTGPWQVQNVQATHRPSQSAFSYAQTPAGPTIGGFIGGGVHASSPHARANYLGSHAFAQTHNTRAIHNPFVASPYQQPATLSARVAPRAYW
ncbi:MAG: hypothetical protein ACMXYD_04240 [Candidatus Woesearchaeota archaeon]